MFHLNKGQRIAIEKCVAWYFDTTYDKKNYFILSGAAGTGKSTVVKTITTVLGLNTWQITYACFTSKAATNLRIKGNPANTIHKTFYNIFKLNGQYFFKVKNSIPEYIKLIIIDEAAMCNDKMLDDIFSFGLPVILLGDRYQLSPVIGKNSLFEDPNNIDAELTEVMRQDDSSGVLDLATRARNGEDLKPGVYKNSRVLFLKDIDDIEKYDIILCYRNTTRKLFNQAVRKKLNINSTYPIKGEKLVGLKNNYFHQIEYHEVPIFPANGLASYCLEDAVKTKNNYLKIKYRPDFIDENGEFFETLCHPDYFDIYNTDIESNPVIMGENDQDDIVHLDFGYCLSVYKAQGSEYKRGLLLDEFKGPRDEYNKYVYTGLTRFSLGVDFCKNFER